MLILTLVFLLRALLEKLDLGILSRKWNARTACYIIRFCFPVFALQLFIILVGPQLSKVKSSGQDLPHYFTSAMNRSDHISLCTYPFLSTIFLGLFAAVLTAYLFWLGRPTLKLVLNKGLWKRVKTLIVSASSFLPLRSLARCVCAVQARSYSFKSCMAVCICMLVYYPVADSFALASDDELATNDAKDAAKAEVPAAGVDALVVVVTVEELEITVEKLEAGEEANEKDVDFVAGALEAAVAGAEDAAMLNPKEDCQNLTFF
ncbi:hypothetical protein CDL15_Pgr027019 [Punica granatum]|uniref:Uncharacterized protein n=1 Tax=Punica granatum TaxID=22663 RepID=A0A218WFW8_PUNGR|nr:hypothetical protein CDL15_Pgr027019 [Punica granatum]